MTYTQAIGLLERVPANGGTNQSEALLDALEMLGINADNLPGGLDSSCDGTADSHCNRSGVNQIVILLTDGYPTGNAFENGSSSVNCYASNLYTLDDGSSDSTYIKRGRDCVMHYAEIAAQAGVKIFTIGLRDGSDTQLLETVANLTGGTAYTMVTPSQLDQVFTEIWSAYEPVSCDIPVNAYLPIIVKGVDPGLQ